MNQFEFSPTYPFIPVLYMPMAPESFEVAYRVHNQETGYRSDLLPDYHTAMARARAMKASEKRKQMHIV